MSFEAITAADLFATSTKKRSQDARQHFIAIGRVAEHDQIRRHLDTCESKVFSLAEVDALWKICHTPASLLGDTGMCIYQTPAPVLLPSALAA